ncbi:DUF732 domain-containing protein [Streptomyces sp. NPDC057854]|uniref:DUF732 domain-containing protein n=1 Tax=unclassified Streptomyces TaxID=2593676 RepID=UPI0036929FA6
MSRLGASIVLVLAAGVAAVGCGGGGDSDPEPTQQETTQSAAKRQDAGFLALLDEHGVLSTKSDAELVELAHVVCEQADLLPDWAEGIAGQLRGKDPSLNAEESRTVLQAAVKTYCPEAG